MAESNVDTILSMHLNYTQHEKRKKKFKINPTIHGTTLFVSSITVFSITVTTWNKMIFFFITENVIFCGVGLLKAQC